MTDETRSMVLFTIAFFHIAGIIIGILIGVAAS